MKRSRATKYLLAAFCILHAEAAFAATPPTELPGPADPGRVHSEDRMPAFENNDDAVSMPKNTTTVTVPEGADKIRFVLKQVIISGPTKFSAEQVSDIYQPYLDKEVTLDVAWSIASAITDRYHNAGYFLSRAYIPAQNVKDGVLEIKIIEGYIGDVELNDPAANHHIVKAHIKDLKSKTPITADEIESFLLRLNDLPGLSFRAVMSAMPDKEEANKGAVMLTLLASEKAGRGMLSTDNYGSRFLGPQEMSANYQTSFIPLQNTTISGIAALPTEELGYVNITQEAAIAPNVNVGVNAGYTKSKPGYTLKEFEVESGSASFGLSVNYQMIRQRDQNLNFKASLDARNTDSDILNTELTHDRVRAVRVSAGYDVSDNWNGLNSANLTLSQGLKVLGASDKGDLNLSRADAEPGFTKAEFSISRMQAITQNWLAILSVSGQVSSDPLFSSEEFGYGGQSFGRAYDNSEITGDDGLASALEIRYGGFNSYEPIGFTPYAFYDIGKVWNDSTTQPDFSGSSAGFGLRFGTDSKVNSNLGVAFPLTLPQGTPIYGHSNKSNPRMLFQIGHQL